MKIAVIGAGSVGSLFSGSLTKAGYDVTLIDKYEDRAVLLNKEGLHVEGVSGTWHVPMKATIDASSIGPVDFVFVCVKAYDSKNAIAQHQVLVGDNTTVATLQNGLGNVPDIASVVGEEKVVGGTTSQGGYLTEPGHFYHAGNGPTHIGEITGETTERLRTIGEMFSKAGIETHISDNIDALIWTKLVINVGINPLTALLHVRNGQTADIEPSGAVQKEAVEEALAVAAAAGIPINGPEVAQKVPDVARVTYENINSMLTDVVKQRRTEIDYINGAICKEGEKVGVPTPVNRILTNLIKATEEAYGKTVE
jgi:2-dehydropantoate 2-reductase